MLTSQNVNNDIGKDLLLLAYYNQSLRLKFGRFFIAKRKGILSQLYGIFWGILTHEITGTHFIIERIFIKLELILKRNSCISTQLERCGKLCSAVASTNQPRNPWSIAYL